MMEAKPSKIGTVYSIACLHTGMLYIGSTINKPSYRFTTHLRELRQAKHVNKHLQNSFTKYGEDTFQFEIVCQYGDISRQALYKIEDQVIASYPDTFNVAKVSGMPPHLGLLTGEELEERITAIKVAKTGRKWSVAEFEAYKKRKKYVHSEESKSKISIAASNRKLTVDERQHLSAIHKGKTLSVEHKHNIGLSNGKTKYKGLVLIDPQGDELIMDTGVPTFAKANALNRHSLQCLIWGKIKNLKGWTLK